MSIQMRLVRRGILAGAVGLVVLGPIAWVHMRTAQAAASQGSRVAPRVMEAVDEAQRVVLRGNVHPKARAEFDRGAVSDAQPITKMLLLLQRSAEQEAELRQLMEEQQSKNSANFHAWLTPEEFGRRFGPADEDVQAVTDWLAGHGFQGIQVSKGKITVQFAGNVGQVRRAFGTEIHRYNVRGEVHFANASDPQIPAALAPVVKGIRALHNFRAQPMLRNIGSFQRTTSGEIRPLFTYADLNGQFFAMGPADFAKIYNVPTGMTGAGQTIAIVGRSNINLSDVAAFRRMFGLPTYASTCTGAPNQCAFNVVLNGPDPGLGPDEVEADLDVEWAGAIAPAATIDFVVTEGTQTDALDGVDGSAMYVVDNNIAPILSESFGSCELDTVGSAFSNALWQQAAAQGISVAVAAGDNGSANCDPAVNQDAATRGPAVSGTASTPFNTALGGTDFDDAGTQSTFWSTSNSSITTPVLASAKGYIPEIPWNDTCARTGSTTACTAAIVNGNQASGIDLVAGSGGHSTLHVKPSWQAGFGAGNARDLPDISLFSSDGGPTAAPSKSFYIICESDADPTGGSGCDLNTNVANANHNFQGVGGTSAAAPAFAGIMALVLQQQAGVRQGLANPVLYNLAKTPANVCPSAANPAATCVFYDIAKGNNSVACVGGSPNCSNTSTSANQFGILTTSAGGSTPAFNATAGYDLATGLGSLNVGNLVTKWASGIPSLTGSSVTLDTLTPPITLGQSVTISGSVTPATATGVVVLENAATGAAIDSGPVSAGAYSFPTTLLPAGSYTVIAQYGGDPTFTLAGSKSAPQAVTIAQQGSKVLVSFVNAAGTLTTAAQNISYGSPYILRIDVTNTSGTPCENASTRAIAFACPTGTVSLFQQANATSPLSDFSGSNAARLNDRGFAEDQPIQLPPGSYGINATFAADANSTLSSSSTSNALAVTVTKATTSAAVTSNVASVAAGGSVTLTATISTTSNGAGPTGTVQFKNGSSNLGSAVTCTPSAANANSAAACTATLSTTLSEMVPLARPRVRNWPQTPILLMLMGAAVAAFLAAQQRKPTGRRVGYAAAGFLLLACVAAGIAGCSGGGSSGGGGGGSHADSITATYGGDANYSGSTSAALTVTVQ